ncbi:MAG: hypothetical protein K2W85_09395 [Phycisphaerales bacterium]|nr:hypothetical protein [Phycisphaerales bacterium]
MRLTRMNSRLVGSALVVALLACAACEGPQPKRRSARKAKPVAETAELTPGPNAATAGSTISSAEKATAAETKSRAVDTREWSGTASSDSSGPRARTATADQREIITPNSASSARDTEVIAAADRAALREKALELLTNAALSGADEERANAIESLAMTPGRLSGVAETALQDRNVAVRTVAAMAVGKAQVKQLAGKVRPLLSDNSPFVQAAAIYSLRRCGVGADPTPLAGMLFDPSTRVRAHAAYILGELGDKSALGPLRDAHKQGGGFGRSNGGELRVSDLQIAEARIKLGDKNAVSDIRSALFPARPEDLEATILAIQIIGQVKDAPSINRLIDLTQVRDPSGQDQPGEVRMAAAMALARMGQPHGSSIAREFFAGGSEALRAQSAHLFGETKRPENLAVLKRMMEDPDGRVRVAAATAIVKVTDAAARRE